MQACVCRCRLIVQACIETTLYAGLIRCVSVGVCRCVQVGRVVVCRRVQIGVCRCLQVVVQSCVGVCRQAYVGVCRSVVCCIVSGLTVKLDYPSSRQQRNQYVCIIRDTRYTVANGSLYTKYNSHNIVYTNSPNIQGTYTARYLVGHTLERGGTYRVSILEVVVVDSPITRWGWMCVNIRGFLESGFLKLNDLL